jgi:RND family efflux transporter MFP subunit
MVSLSRYALVAVLVVAGCIESEAEREERAIAKATPRRLQADGSIKLSEADRAALDLRVEVVIDGALPDGHVRLGRILARPGDEALLVAPVSARVTNVSPLAMGSEVVPGVLLVEVVPVLSAGEAVSLSVQTADLEGQLRAAERELSFRESAATRARELSSSAIVSTQVLEEAETSAATTRARVEALGRARSMQLSGGASRLALKAPIAGRLVALDVSLGAIVHPGDVLARVLKSGSRWIDVAVSPDDPAGVAYEIQAGGSWVPGRLVTRGGVVGADGTRRDRLEVDAAQAASLLPGATVSVRVAIGEARGVLVPEAALVPGVGSDVVYVETAPGVYTPRSVRVVARFGGRARVAGGLAAGTHVVVQGAMSLRGESLRSELRHTE